MKTMNEEIHVLKKQIRELRGEKTEEEIKEEIEEPEEEPVEEEPEGIIQDEIFELPNLDLESPVEEKEEPEKLINTTDMSEYICPECEKKFANKGLLTAHTKKCRGKENG